MTRPGRDALRVAFIGSAGIPNRYGGFESFLANCCPELAKRMGACTVTCDASLYPDDPRHCVDGVRRVLLPIRANGVWSVLHDLLAFLAVFRQSTHIVVLGVSGGPWFPLFRILCSMSRRALLVNIDGVEWRREKFGAFRRTVLRVFDAIAQISAHRVIIDNEALRSVVRDSCLAKTYCIPYPGDQVIRHPAIARQPNTALTVCRIEPENQIEMLIEGALKSNLSSYAIVGNWEQTPYGRTLRKRYGHEPRLMLLDPIYDPERLSEWRERAGCYIHGHSVGGTNPSLVEMIWYDCRLLCFDCPYNRETAQDAAEYFENAEQLARMLTVDTDPVPIASRDEVRARYTTQRIADAYERALLLATTRAG